MYGYMPMYYFDPTYVLIIIGVLLSMGASAKLNATYGRYSSVASRCGMTGAQAAQRILQSQGIYDVTVRHVSGRLTDHYDPRSKTVNLSDTVYGLPLLQLLVWQPMSVAMLFRMQEIMCP